MTEPDLANALIAFAESVGADAVVTDPATLTGYATTTFRTANRVAAILRPADVQQVQECVRIANRHGVALYPLSTGRNIGYGSRVPTSDGAVVLELGRLNRIRDYSESLAYVTIEPGVTQQQLYDFLRQQNSRLWLDVTGAPADHSVIGNTVERGFGHTPYGDHFLNTSGLEVVLPDGALITTGFGRFPNARATEVYRWGVGPAFDGLFTQSNFGIVTAMTVWLMPAPERLVTFYFSVDEEHRLGELVERLRPLCLDGTIRSAMHIGNDYKVLSSIRQYPWQAAGGRVPLSREVLAEFSRSWDFGAWNASGALYGSRAQVKDARRRIRRALKPHVKRLRFLDERLLGWAERLQRPYKRITGVDLPEMLKIIKPVFGMMRGVPTDAMLPSTYWRRRGPVPEPADPDRDRVGLYWCAPVAPADAGNADRLWRIVRDTVAAGGFEPAISVTLINPRAIDAVISIGFDRDQPGEDAAAEACHAALLENLTVAGYYPYRLGIAAMGVMEKSDPAASGLHRKLKQALDPAGVLAPGRYLAE